MHPHIRSSRIFAVVCIAFSSLLAVPGPAVAAQPAPPVLARVDVRGPLVSLGLPVYADLMDSGRHEYALVIAPLGTLSASAAAFDVLDTTVSQAGYLIALERRKGARDAAAARFPVLLDDGRHILVRDAPGRADALAELGLDVARLSDAPLVLREAPIPTAPELEYDADVAAMIGAVTQATVNDYDGNLSGENPVTVGGAPYTIATRNTSSGTPIQKATQYVYEFMQGLGLTVSYHTWNSATNPNVIAEKTGVIHPNEIVLVTAHLDDMPSGALAPGADDNASGSVGVLIAAEVMSPYTFDRTVRFVLFTGEEQGLLGSSAYATMIKNAGDNVVAVYNMDMIAWDSTGGPTLRLHTRTTGNPGYPADLAIATLFEDVVSTYGLSGGLTPIIDPDGITASDHASFWSKGYAGILAIEDDVSDFCAYYHTVNDKRQYLNMDYFTNYVKASVGTVAHLAIPGEPPCELGCQPTAAEVDTHPASATVSDLNGIFEPGETVMLAPTWHYPAGCATSTVTGEVLDPVAPLSLTVTLTDPYAFYSAMTANSTANCFSRTGNCYLLRLNEPAQRPATHVDVTVKERLSTGTITTWILHVGDSFSDVPRDFWAYSFVETLLHSGITSGCGGSSYCPGATVSRWQMAVFLAGAMVGDPPVAGTVPGLGNYDCSPGGASLFADVPPTDGGCASIHYIAAQGITAGCGNGNYCPTGLVSRWQMGVFLAGAMVGDPPVSGTVPGKGAYNCVLGGVSLFADVPPENGGCASIHYLAAQGVTSGCGNGNYCPASNLKRDQMAVFMTSAFDLHLYGP